MATDNNHIKTIIYLLEHRIGKIQYDINFQNSKGESILHKAAKLGFTQIVSFLLSLSDSYIEKDLRNNNGWTPLMYAVSGGHK